MASFSRRVILDIGADRIRLGEVLPDRKGSPFLRNLKTIELGIDPTKTAEIFPVVMEKLDGLLMSSGIKPGPTTLGLGGPSVFSRVIKVPQTDPSQVKQIVGFEAQQVVPAIEEACWDFQLFASGGGAELEAMILAVKKDSIEEMMAAANKAGLSVEGVELAPASIINAFRYNYPDKVASVLILEIGARSTQIIMVEGDKLFCRIVPIGGCSVTQAIAADLQESFAGAEILKKAKGFIHPGGSYEDPPDEIAARISKLSRGVFTRLHTEVERSITFFRSQQGGGRPTQVFLAGGGAQLGLIDFFFQEKLKVPVQFFQPFRRLSIEGEVSADLQKCFTGWTTFVGAALRELPDSPCRLNLVSKLNQKALSRVKEKPAMLATGVAILALMFLPGVHGFWQSAKMESSLTPQREQIELAEITVKKLQDKQKEITDVVGVLEAALTLEKERLRWPLLLEELAKKSKPGMWITKVAVVPLATPGTGKEVPSANPGSQPASMPIVEISGIFETKSEESDAQVVELFRKSLEEGQVLKKIVTTQRETPERTADGKTEQVALKFTIRGEWPTGEPETGQRIEKTKIK